MQLLRLQHLEYFFTQLSLQIKECFFNFDDDCGACASMYSTQPNE